VKIRIFGDSHVNVLRRGWEKLQGEEKNSRDLHLEFYASHGTYWLGCTATETDSGFRLDQLARGREQLDDYVVEKKEDILYFFSSPLHSAPLYRNRIWKTCCPWVCVPQNPDLQGLSATVIEHWAGKQVRRRIELLDKLREGGISLAVIEPPKPLKRTPKMFGIRPDVLSVASRHYRDYVSSLLEERRIPIIHVPSKTYDESGFSKSSFAPKNLDDCHHGNVLFGCEVVKEIVKFVDG
jgi:hypothetical protein